MEDAQGHGRQEQGRREESAHRKRRRKNIHHRHGQSQWDDKRVRISQPRENRQSRLEGRLRGDEKIPPPSSRRVAGPQRWLLEHGTHLSPPEAEERGLGVSTRFTRSC